jgi:aminoglycoside/choline kinase family phosphotransferase
MSKTPATSDILWPSAQRHERFANWLASLDGRHHLVPDSLRIASADASFRRYLRIDLAAPEASGATSRIIMDAPPDKENSQPFVAIARLMATLGLRVPEVLDWQEQDGFLLLTDLGHDTMMSAVNPGGQPVPAAQSLPLYQGAIDALVAWQQGSQPGVLPPYDEALLRRELALFPDWYLQQHKGLQIDPAMRATLDKTFGLIVERCLAWPSVFVHRDFMPRNLMLPGLPDTRLGVLDFQDAVYGPITYDIASLMRDAFLSWDEPHVLDVTIRYWERARRAGLPVGDDFGAFYQGVEWMGLQRHLKVAGIFARLTLRDGKPKYLADAPRFVQYILATCRRYVELRPLQRLVEQVEGIVPAQGFAYGRV